jgi:hypothetical protein
MIAEFDWWLLIVGLGVGAAVTWLVLVDLGRRDQDLTARERVEETAWIEAALADRGRPTSPETIGRVLELHAAYVQRPVPPGPEPAEPEPSEPEPAEPEPEPAEPPPVATPSEASEAPSHAGPGR